MSRGCGAEIVMVKNSAIFEVLKDSDSVGPVIIPFNSPVRPLPKSDGT